MEYLNELERGKPNLFFRTMANKPEVLKSFVPLYRSVMAPGALENRIKELAYLAVSFANECRYCTAAHIKSAGKAGIEEAEIRALQTEQDQNFTKEERAAIQYARELTRTCDADDSRDAVQLLYSDDQIVELTLVVAMANFTNRFNNGLEIEPED